MSSLQLTVHLGMKELTVFSNLHLTNTTLLFSNLRLLTAWPTWLMVTTISVYYVPSDCLSLSNLQILHATCFRIPHLSNILKKASGAFFVITFVRSCLFTFSYSPLESCWFLTLFVQSQTLTLQSFFLIVSIQLHLVNLEN